MDMKSMIGVLAAFFCAALSGMGVGGGGLFLIYLTALSGTPQRQAQLYNLVFFVCASGASLIYHACRRNIRLPVVILLASGGVFGAYLGSLASGAVGDGALRAAFGAFLVLTGTLSLFRRGEGKEENRTKNISGRNIKK